MLESRAYLLGELSINAGISSKENQPVTISTINRFEITTKLGERPLPLVLQSIPGVYSYQDGGGRGDAKLSIRGFQQDDISILLNGIPINGEENGLIYWSNWLGLANSTTEIQVQKGLGLSNASVSSIGGSVNIITHNSRKQKSGFVKTEVSDYGYFSNTISYNTGKLNNGWSNSFMINLGYGDGYVDATQSKSFSYFFSAYKKYSEKFDLSFTLLGAPQRHAQRTIKLSKEEVDQYGLKYNKDWGNYNGKVKSASENFYHKPFISLNTQYKFNDNNKMSNVLYVSGGLGGGKWSESFNYSPSIFSYRNETDQIDWDKIHENNSLHDGSYTLQNGNVVNDYSLNVQTDFLASHILTGFMSNFEYILNNKISVLSGFHYKYFNSYLREQISDLLGGKYFIEDYGWSLAGVGDRNQLKLVGDIIRVDNNSIKHFANIYGQIVYKNNVFNSFISANLNNNWYKRIDRFNYLKNTKSKLVLKPGFDLRTGILYNLLHKKSLFINAAFVSRAPYFKYVFGNFNNSIVKDLKNEIVQSIEMGFKYQGKTSSAIINAFITKRYDVSTLSNEYIQLDDNSQTRAMINGLNSRYLGVEFELNTSLFDFIKLNTHLSIGDFKWLNDVNATLFNDGNIAIDTVNVYAKNLYLGGTAQNQFGLSLDFKLSENIYIKPEFLVLDKIYSNYSHTNRSNPNDRNQAFQIPSYELLNLYIWIPFKVKSGHARFQVNTYNLLNKKYIVNGEDGSNHDLDSFKGFWSQGRYFNFSLMYGF